MSFGLKVFNDLGDLSIDSTWLNYSLMVESSATFAYAYWNFGASGSPTWPVTNIILPYTITSAEPPIFFAKVSTLPSAPATVSSVVPTGSPGAWTGFRVYCQSQTSGSFTMGYRIYGILPLSQSYGLAVRDDSGGICFDSGRQPLVCERVIDVSEWVSVFNSSPAPGFRERGWEVVNPTEEYVSLSTMIFYDGISSLPGGRIFFLLSKSPDYPDRMRMTAVLDSGTSSITPGPGSGVGFLPMLCDAT